MTNGIAHSQTVLPIFPVFGLRGERSHRTSTTRDIRVDPARVGPDIGPAVSIQIWRWIFICSSAARAALSGARADRQLKYRATPPLSAAMTAAKDLRKILIL
jgi:hypothetical protein